VLIVAVAAERRCMKKGRLEEEHKERDAIVQAGPVDMYVSER
jgi:hypothetical protein